jgi:hypothetical protein
MKQFFAGIRRWWLRRFRGYVAAPPRSGGTSWQQHRKRQFKCRCGWPGVVFDYLFDDEKDYVIRSQDHVEGCQFPTVDGKPLCSCPVTDARYVKICPECGLGHWAAVLTDAKNNDASPKGIHA